MRRMFIVGHEVAGSEKALEISFDIVGSTGNLYKTVIRKEPTCDCPDGAKRNQCKHICYGKTARKNPHSSPSPPPQLTIHILFLLMTHQVLLHALKAPSHLQYQLAFLSSVSVDLNIHSEKGSQVSFARSSAKCTMDLP